MENYLPPIVRHNIYIKNVLCVNVNNYYVS
jgi:hypothetical protein